MSYADGAASRRLTPAEEARDSDTVDLSGRWVNDGGTVIDLRSHGDGRVSGTVRFADAGVTYQLFPLRGTCVERPDGQRGIVGTVPGWPQPSSMTVWCAELDTDGAVLSTKLLNTAESSTPPCCEGTCGGNDFRRAPAPRRRRRSV